MAKKTARTKTTNRTVLMLSGGPDSATLASDLQAAGHDVHAIFFDYGQLTANAELSSARSIARQLSIDFEVINISTIKHAFLGLSDPGIVGLGFRGAAHNCPHGLFGITASYACLVEANGFAVGLTANDFQEVPAVDSYIEKYQDALAVLQRGFKVIAPFRSKSKSAVFSLGNRHGVPFQLTWSCSVGPTTHCGICKQCADRKAAFAAARIADPTVYKG